MAIEITDWVSMGGVVISFLAYLEAKKANDNSRETMDALVLVVDASKQTQSYLSKRKQGEPRDYNTEYQLAELWSRASFLIGRVNKDLAVRLHAKSKFWRNQNTWEGDLRATKDISLEYVNAKAKELPDLYA